MSNLLIDFLKLNDIRNIILRLFCDETLTITMLVCRFVCKDFRRIINAHARLHYKKIKYNGYQIPHDAASSGNLDLLKWVCDLGYELSFFTYDGAARNGHLEIIKWIFEEGHVVWDRQLCVTAAKYGQLNILKWIRQDNVLWDQRVSALKRICQTAFQYGHSEIVEWAQQNGLEFG
jgi:hypothetical protein